jgi:hypothetical protein
MGQRPAAAVLSDQLARAALGLCINAAALGCEAPAGSSAPQPIGPSAAPTSPVGEPTRPGGGPTEAKAPAEMASFACDENASGQPAELRRLTMTQYRNTLRDLLRSVLDEPSEADAVLSSAGVDSLPVDRREPTPRGPHGSYRRLDQAVDQSHVDETFRVATALGAALTTPERLSGLVGPCVSDTDAGNDEKCLSDFVSSFGARALRRPLADSDRSFYRAIYGSSSAPDPAAYAGLITVLLSAPEFLYFVEHGKAEVPLRPGTYELSPYELASRLSYHFWQTLPDDELWLAAKDGSLLEPEVLAQQADRLMGDERARETMTELFVDFLELDELPALDARAQDPSFQAFAGEDLPGPELREHAIDEALGMLAYYTWTVPGGVPELFTSALSFARSPGLARLYGVTPWDGNTPPPTLPGAERRGLLSRLWFLASGSANTRPILRGAFVRRSLLCDELAPPPANVATALPERKLGETTRQAVEKLTEQAGTQCASCHEGYINPLGFAFEGFDSLGRFRTEERLFSDDGTQVGTLPIDVRSVPRVSPSDERASSGVADLVDLMLQSGKLEACLVRNYFRFSFGRYEELGTDGCALERLRSRLAESGSIRAMLAEVARLPEMRQRHFESPPGVPQ